VQRFALDRKLSCCWQDRAAAASDPGLAAFGGCVRRRQDCPPVASASNRDGWPAIFGSYPDRPDGIPDRRQSSGGAAVGILAHCKRTDRAETPRAGRAAHNSDNAVRPYRRCLTKPERGKSLETFVELVPHPRRWRFLSTTKPAKLRLFYSGADSQSGRLHQVRLTAAVGGGQETGI